MSREKSAQQLDAPFGNLVAKLGVASSTDQLDLVRHFAGHCGKRSEGPVRRQDQRKVV